MFSFVALLFAFDLREEVTIAIPDVPSEEMLTWDKLADAAEGTKLAEAIPV